MNTTIPILQQLTAARVENGHWSEPRGNVASVHAELAPGCFVHVCLGHAGVIVRHGDVAVGIPLADLLELVVQHQPDFKVPTPEELKAAELKARHEERLAAAAKASPSPGGEGRGEGQHSLAPIGGEGRGEGVSPHSTTPPPR